ncbi:hypothetical protein [Streptomyces sp. A5-4]|uniref:hypothetical protein n=1 Tax=Streptomyces sp. A5-4 TaxID=3384771 RepID=UPI003DAA2A0B
MPRAGTPRRRGAVAVSVLLGALLALLMCSGSATAATGPATGLATGPATGPDARLAAADARAPEAVTVAGASAPDAGPTAQALPGAAFESAAEAAPAAVGEQRVPGCGKSPGGDSGTGPGTPARGSPSYELLHALYDARAASGPWGTAPVLPTVEPDRGPPPLDPPSPIDLSVLRV